MKTRHSSPWIFRFGVLAVCLVSFGCSFNPLWNKQAYLQRGQTYMAKGKYREASIEFQKALKRDPRSIEAFTGLAQAEISLHQVNGAYGALQQAVALAPDRSDLHLEFGKLCLSGHLYSKAEQEATSALNRDAHNAAAYELLGSSELGEKSYQAAAEAFQKLIELRPADGAARVNLALAYIAMERYPEAEQNLRQAIVQDPHFIPASLDLANLYRLEKQPDPAQKVLQQAADANPGATALGIALADLLYSQQDGKGAEAELRKLDARANKTAEDCLALGDFYLQWKQSPRAIQEYQRGLQAAPHDLQIENHLVDAYLATGRVPEASALNQDALQHSPDDIDAHIEHGRVLLAENRMEDAILELRQQVTAAPDSWQAHYFLGLAYWRRGSLDEAPGELEHALRIFNNSPTILHSLAELNLEKGELRIAEDYAQRVLALSDNRADEHLLLGNIYFQGRKYPEAREQFVIARDLAPDHVAVHMALAEADAEGRNMPEAEAELEAALRLQPQNTEALGRLADLWVAQRQTGKALDRVQQYLTIYPNDSSAHIVLGSLLQNQHADLAKAEFARAIQLDPKSLQGYLRLGRLLQQEGNLPDALFQYQEALKLQPNYPPLSTLIGNLYMQQGNLAAAEGYFQAALAADPNFAVAAGNLAWVYLKRDTNLNLALSLAEKAKQLMPDVDSISDTLAMVYYKKGLYSSAIPLFEECVQKAPLDPSYRYHLGMALVAIGKEQRARQELRAALRLNLPSDDADQARHALQTLP